MFQSLFAVINAIMDLLLFIVAVHILGNARNLAKDSGTAPVK